MKERVKKSTISQGATIAEALARLDQAGTGALLLCDPSGHLCGLATDGDIRRAILRGTSLNSPCLEIATRKPITAGASVTPSEASWLMDQHDILQLPVLDSEGRVERLLLREDFTDGGTDAKARLRVKDAIVSPTASITEAMAQLDRVGTGALMLCDAGMRLVGVLTDGDLRRAILQRKPLSDACNTIANRYPITARFPISPAEALRLMNEQDIRHLPVVDAAGRVQRFLLRNDLSREAETGLSAVVMAGGFGTRLLPLTQNVPKPMLPVGERPLLELTIAQLRKAGIKDVHLTTHYLPEAIMDHFGDGQNFGVHMNYLREEHPLGTAGGLKLLGKTDATMLVINGDVLTGVPFQAMVDYHRAYGAELTVGVRKYEVQVPFGVVECDNARVTGLQEKPSLSFFINAGTYLIEPTVYDLIPAGQRFDMTELIQRMVEAGRVVMSFPITEYWLDIGRHEDYQKAQQDILKTTI